MNFTTRTSGQDQNRLQLQYLPNGIPGILYRQVGKLPDKRERSKSPAGKSVVEFYDTDKRQRSKSPAIAVSTQWDSRDFVPTSRETATINLAHATTAKYQGLGFRVLWKCFHPSFSALLLVSWVASQVQFVICNEQILIGQSLKKRGEATEAPQNRRFYLRLPSLWLTYIFERSMYNLCENIWVKGEVLWRTCWEIHWELGENIENSMGTFWELKGNIMGIRENWKRCSSTQLPHLPFSQLKRKKCKAPWVHAWAFQITQATKYRYHLILFCHHAHRRHDLESRLCQSFQGS